MRDGKTVDQEQALLDYVVRLERFAEGRRAIIVHLSELRPYNRREHHFRIAASCFDKLSKKHESALFRLASGDHVFITKGATIEEIEEPVTRLRYLFSLDPLLSMAGTQEDKFCTWFNLETDWAELKKAAETALTQRRAEATQRPKPKPQAEPLDPRRLGQIEQTIATADLSPLVRRQPICLAIENRQIEPLLLEIFVSIGELGRAVMPGVDIAADRWLFQHLTRLLDQRVLSLLKSKGEIDPKRGFSLNLNVATVLSPEFQEFDRVVGAERASAAVIELQQIDIYADPGSYMFAREWLKERGYKICVDGVKPLLMPLVDRERLGVDLVKLEWTPDLSTNLDNKVAHDVQEAIERIGRDRVILSRCENEACLELGQKLGITMYQGHHFDALMRARVAGGAAAAPAAAAAPTQRAAS
ncbi:EAL domain-containing protein [Hypericibacter adhaerens]|nr:EAL domain-containing protein [Hypericibacter adhaerens]